eukprot:3792983-Prymnesium_polylepis.2
MHALSSGDDRTGGRRHIPFFPRKRMAQSDVPRLPVTGVGVGGHTSMISASVAFGFTFKIMRASASAMPPRAAVLAAPAAACPPSAAARVQGAASGSGGARSCGAGVPRTCESLLVGLHER